MFSTLTRSGHFWNYSNFCLSQKNVLNQKLYPYIVVKWASQIIMWSRLFLGNASPPSQSAQTMSRLNLAHNDNWNLNVSFSGSYFSSDTYFLFIQFSHLKKFKGKMDKIMDEIPCCQVEADEERFLKIIEEAIKEKEVKPYKAFTNGELRLNLLNKFRLRNLWSLRKWLR